MLKRERHRERTLLPIDCSEFPAKLGARISLLTYCGWMTSGLIEQACGIHEPGR